MLRPQTRGLKGQFKPFALVGGLASFVWLGADTTCLLLGKWLTQGRKWGPIVQ